MNKVGWLIYSEADAKRNQSFIDWFIEEGKQQNINIQFVLREELTISIVNNKQRILRGDKNIPLPDFAIVRTIEPVLSHFLKATHVKVFNSPTIAEVANNKSLTHMEVNKLGIPMVDTIMVKKETLSGTPPTNYPFVIKEATGRSGAQVHLIETKQDWAQCLPVLANGDVVIQSCDVQRGKDVRVFIVGKEIIGAILRESNEDFRANFTLGGSATWYDLNEKQIAMINTITVHFNFGMVGIDFLIAKDGTFLFNEIEDIVGSRILSEVSDINIVQKYVSYIKQQL